jgi:hypothetical protein
MKRNPHELQYIFWTPHRNFVFTENSASISKAGAALRTRNFIMLHYFGSLSTG